MHTTETRLHTLLEKLHRESETQLYARARAQFSGSDAEFLELARQYQSLAPRLKGEFLKQHGLSSEDQSGSPRSDLSLAVSPALGELLQCLVLAQRSSRILELGSSNGVSTLYLAAALEQLGAGKLLASEYDAAKCARLREHVTSAGLAHRVELRQGDVMDTLAKLDGTFDLVFMDIWSNLYLDAFKQLERLLHPGSLVVTDNMFTAQAAVQAFKAYVQNNPRYSSITLDFESGVELTVVL